MFASPRLLADHGDASLDVGFHFHTLTCFFAYLHGKSVPALMWVFTFMTVLEVWQRFVIFTAICSSDTLKSLQNELFVQSHTRFAQ